MTVDGFAPAGATDSESVDAVRSVIAEALDREGDWAALASAGLLSLPVPEAHGGDGLGLPEVAVMLRATGARATHLPVWETLCCGVLTLAASGTSAQQEAWLPGVATGDVVLTPALREVGRRLGERPETTYSEGTVSGRKIGVTYAADAARLLVTARDGRGRGRRARRPPRSGGHPARVRLLGPHHPAHGGARRQRRPSLSKPVPLGC